MGSKFVDFLTQSLAADGCPAAEVFYSQSLNFTYIDLSWICCTTNAQHVHDIFVHNKSK